MKRRTVRVIRVFRSALDPRRGRIRAGSLDLVCALGRSGPVLRKREGDGGTPIGRFRVLGGFYRPDRFRGRPLAGIPLRPIRPDDGWCDEPTDRRYNRPVRLPFPKSHERLWREDALYDLVLDLSHNRRPAVPGRGSAIFLHSARDGFTPTEGCVAVARSAIARLVRLVGRGTVLTIGDRRQRRRRCPASRHLPKR